MSTNAYAAKRAIVNRAKQLVEPTGPITAQIKYAWSGAPTSLSVRGGFITFDQPEEEELPDGKGVLIRENAIVGLHITAVLSPPPPDGVEASDRAVEQVGKELGAMLAAEPGLCGRNTSARIVGGQGDYTLTDDAVTSRLSYRISVKSYLDPQRT